MYSETATSPPTGRTPIVWLVNQGGHDYRDLDRFGRVMAMTTESVNPFAIDRLMITLGHYLSMAQADDYLAISGMAILNGLAMTMWATKFEDVRLLQYATKEYIYKPLILRRSAMLQNIKNG